MFRITRRVLLSLFALMLPFVLHAEAGKCGAGKCGGAMQASKTTTDKRPSPESLKAAYTLLETMHMADNYKRMIDQITDMQIAQAPQLAAARDAIQEFFAKYMGWDAIKKDIATLYAKNYTKEELEKMNSFFSTDAGQKYITLTPKIATETAQIGQKRLQQHMGEFQKVIEAKLKELMAKNGAKKSTEKKEK